MMLGTGATEAPLEAWEVKVNRDSACAVQTLEILGISEVEEAPEEAWEYKLKRAELEQTEQLASSVEYLGLDASYDDFANESEAWEKKVDRDSIVIRPISSPHLPPDGYLNNSQQSDTRPTPVSSLSCQVFISDIFSSIFWWPSKK